MRTETTLPERQEFIGNFSYHHDEAHYDELPACYAEDVHYLSRNDSGVLLSELAANGATGS